MSLAVPVTCFVCLLLCHTLSLLHFSLACLRHRTRLTGEGKRSPGRNHQAPELPSTTYGKPFRAASKNRPGMTAPKKNQPEPDTHTNPARRCPVKTPLTLPQTATLSHDVDELCPSSMKLWTVKVPGTSAMGHYGKLSWGGNMIEET